MAAHSLEEAKQSLLQWIQTFESAAERCGTLPELADGVILIDILKEIVPDYVDSGGLRRDTGDNWALRLSNLRILVKSLQRIYHDCLGQDATIDDIDLSSASRDGPNQDEPLIQLCELVLGVAVQCKDKHIYIARIMENLDQQAQVTLMFLIDGIMHRFPDVASPGAMHMAYNSPAAGTPKFAKPPSTSPGAGGAEFWELQSQVASLQESNSQLETSLADARRQHAALRSAVEDLQHERDLLQTKLKDSQKSESQPVFSGDQKDTQLAKQQRFADAQLQDLKVLLDEKETELSRSRQQNADRIKELEDELRRQADELDIARSKVVQLSKVEATIGKYKTKLEEISTIKQHIKDVEEQNSQYLDKILDLESSVKIIPTLKAQIEKYKDKVVDLETALVEATSNASVKDQKILRLQEEIESAAGAKDFLEEQLESARNELSDLKGGDGAVGVASTAFGAASFGGGSSLLELREKVARLERENATLKAGTQGSTSEQVSSLQNQLDDALRVKSNLERSALEQRHRCEELEADVSSLKETLKSIESQKLSSSDSASAEALQAQRQSQQRIFSLEAERDGLLKQIEEISKRSESQDAADSHRATVDELTKRLKQKETQINTLMSEKEKLENYTKKTLHAVQAKYMVAVTSHKNQLQEKNNKIIFLESKLAEDRASQKREEALLMSAFYEIGLELQRRNMTVPPGGQNKGKPASWLNRQRQEERGKRNNNL